MNREPSTTPHASKDSPTRRLFEVAYGNNNQVLEHTIRLDTAVKNLQERIYNEPADVGEAHQWLSTYADTLTKTLTSEQLDKSSITDSARFAGHITFAEEQLLAPLAYGDKDEYTLRRQLTDGVLGKSVDLIEPLLMQISRRTRPDDIREIIGAINEQTAIALLNFSEHPDHLAMPSEATDDILRGTDVYLYSRHQDKPYSSRYRISVKTNRSEAKREKERHDEIVISGADMHNPHLTISRLLVRYIAGSPGVSKDELQKLHAAKDSVWATVLEQAAHSNFEICYDALIAKKGYARVINAAAKVGRDLAKQTKNTAS